jgi:hypothetical protein
MKIFAYRNGFSISMKMTYFDRYWFRDYDRISYDFKDIKGIPTPFVSLILYILTLGVLILPTLWRYTYSVIPYKHIGTWFKYESDIFEGVSNYRFSKVLFVGFLYYAVVAFLLKAFSFIFGDYFYWFIFVIFWIAFFNLIPIIGCEGWELFIRGKFGWVSSITVLVLTMISVLLFESMIYVLSMAVVSFFIVMMVILWRQLVLEKW